MSTQGRGRAEQEPTDQQTHSESTKPTGRQNSKPNFCATMKNTVGNNFNAKTLIEYNIDETLDIKEEIVQDEEEHQCEKHNFRSERNQVEEKFLATEISSNNNSGTRTLTEYSTDETLDIKEEISQDKDGHQRGNLDLLSETNQLDEKYITSEVHSDNNSGIKTLIDHDYDESLEIKEEIIQGGTVKKPWTPKEEKIQESKSEQKNKYKCEKCARSYAQKKYLNAHKRFECGVMPQFRCEFCSKKFKRKRYVNEHKLRMHQKTDSKASETRHNCDQCSRSYSTASGLNQHKRSEHATVRSQFICDFCCFHTHRKDILSKHINSLHMPKVHLSVLEREYKCEKCGRSYIWKAHYNRHKKFECDVRSQFICDFCCLHTHRKDILSKHINSHHMPNVRLSVREKKYMCDKCGRSYIRKFHYNRHKKFECDVRSKFICDFCCFHTHRKDTLSKHINSRHMPKVHLSVREREYKCEKCSRSYFWKSHYNRHKKFECDVIPQFSCEFCRTQFRRKSDMNRHIFRMHQEKKT